MLDVKAGLIAAALIVASASPSIAATWRVSPTESRLYFNYVEDGAPGVGVFTRFDAAAEFDPDTPANAALALKIDMDSVEMPDVFRTGFVKGGGWFDVDAHPTATFELNKLAPTALAGVFIAEGAVTIKGVTRDLAAETVLIVDETRAFARGEVSFDRNDFNVDGDAPFVEIGPTVTVVFSLVARPAP